MIELPRDQVLAARRGSREALAAVVAAAAGPVFNLAVRMLANRADAEDATQEILILIVTHLDGLRDVDAAGAWAMRIACRHLVHERARGRIERMRLTFDGFAADLAQGLAPLPDGELTEAEQALAVDEVRIGCTLAMLVCLSRELRIAYILGDVFDLTDTEAASLLEITPAAYRQRLRRARAAVTEFVTARCGIVSDAAACRCEHRVAAALRLGRIERGQRQLERADETRTDVASLRAHIAGLERARAAAALMRANPQFTSAVAERVVAAFDTAGDRSRHGSA